ncbi:TrmB family transcriptional regulator (plasmid) [Haloferax mediterranei ATCC 33500]|uniref:TrmB family transcriptional regulator n=1 Tax=Haloferax mediterranei (strain ATCC 33500 / DSM 1411 / JCM 8866 / NBRC 14739 / NCIMB 2177 / R-4) TaxID=523841 RepID=I3RAC9_HALMT|nr:hypothetical protein [Haloferax mediterranei]AFK21189.1 hypothetical protein HFX_6062 [Haloferax mediterranei ATCC 33500]AHZ24697.1 TrmB family transcriptional regulator [Haloferax mediterranei ATCC 33500]ELZ97476.1 hypothetical protein C439_19178 [Haloferax mediterranei ATCC 33500]MDX5990232.1 TrmB family transcriptional regulator [Haloferax mediterranei ATCC 33500]QCQ76697.1 TrmB family transcriptional regulator [Haloferax mediterranei ATCC 33500]
MNMQALDTNPEQNRTEMPITISNFAIPSALESSGTKLVYLYLDAANGGDISELRASLGMKTITLYPLLQTLEKNGLVECDGDEYHIAA